jgi:hypothetical protein
MSVNLTGTGVVSLAGVVVIGGVAYYLYTHRKALVEAVNPMSPKNLASQTADKLTQAFTGDKTQTFGSWAADLFLPKFDPKEFTGAAVKATLPGTPNVQGSGNTTVPGWEGNPMGMAGWTPAYDGRLGRMVLVPPLTPVTWVIIAGVSYALYMHKQSRRRGRR